MSTKIRLKKTKYIRLRVSDPELTLLREKAALAGCTISELTRKALERTRTWTVDDKNIAREQISQIARIGNNINQLAKWANTFKSYAEAAQIISHLIAIERLLRSLLQNASNKGA